MNRDELLLQTHSEIAEQVRYADTKSALIVAGTVVLLIAVLDGASGAAADAEASCLAVSSGLVAVVLQVASIALAMAAIFPRVGPSSSRLSWVSVAKRGETEFTVFVAEQDGDELRRELAIHTWELSVIAQKKYKLVSLSLVAAGLSLVPAMYALWAVATRT